LYLYSTGQEGVRFVWQLSAADGNKGFFPRLGRPVSNITTSWFVSCFQIYSFMFLTCCICSDLMGGIRVALTTIDNSVRIINTSTMKEEWTLRSLCLTSKKNSIFKKSVKNRGHKDETPAATQPFLQNDNSWNVQLKCESLLRLARNF
jgi:hypothetical protein